MKPENLQFSDLAHQKNGEQPRCQASSGKRGTASHTLHRTTIQQRFVNPCGLLVRLKLMQEAAKKLEFIEAAQYRDELLKLEDLMKEKWG